MAGGLESAEHVKLKDDDFDTSAGPSISVFSGGSVKIITYI